MVNTRASWRLTLKRKAAQRQPAVTPARLVLPRRFFSRRAVGTMRKEEDGKTKEWPLIVAVKRLN